MIIWSFDPHITKVHTHDTLTHYFTFPSQSKRRILLRIYSHQNQHFLSFSTIFRHGFWQMFYIKRKCCLLHKEPELMKISLLTQTLTICRGWGLPSNFKISLLQHKTARNNGYANSKQFLNQLCKSTSLNRSRTVSHQIKDLTFVISNFKKTSCGAKARC